jgi:gas vesicle protein
MRSVPRYIYELSNYITIFKTNDSSEMTARELKDDRLEEIMNNVKANKNQHFFMTLKIY